MNQFKNYINYYLFVLDLKTMSDFHSSLKVNKMKYLELKLLNLVITAVVCKE